MKYFVVVLAASLFILTGCDRSVPILINKEKSYSVETSCGKVEFKASVFSYRLAVGQSFKTGEFEMNFDSLAVSVQLEGTSTLNEINFYDNYELTSIRKKSVKAGNSVFVEFLFNQPINSLKGTLLILPCKYIMCDGKPLITDTLRINF